MKPIIGVMPLWDDEKKSLWMLPGYLDGIAQQGGIPVIFPFSDKEDDLKQLMSACDGFLFTGGHDVLPSLYGEEPLQDLLERDLLDCCEKRDRMELIILSGLLSACVTAFAGPISFVGIAVPFLVKRALGTSKPIVVIPAAFLGGAVFCMVSDLIARMAFSPTELNISTVTSILGAPVVIYMLIRKNR